MRAHLAAVARASSAAFTEIRFEHRRGTAILQRGSEVVFTAAPESAGGLVRCHTPGFGWGVATFRSLDGLGAAISQALEGSLAFRGRDTSPLPPVPARELEVDCPAERDPSRVPLGEKIELAAMVTRTIRGTDRRVAGTRVRYDDCLVETIVVTSEGISLREVRPELSLAALAVAEEGGTVERATGSIASAGQWTDLEAWSRTAYGIGERAVLQLRAAPVRAGRYAVVLDPQAAGFLAHRAVGHLCEADADGAGPLASGTRLGSEIVTIGDDGTAFGRRGTAAFDHEGMAPVPTILVQHGVVVGHVHSRVTAARAGTRPTGNARGSGLEPPRARLSNTYIASGRVAFADLLADVPLGVYLSDPVGVSLDDGTAGVRAGHARMIRRGELAEPVKGVTLEADPLVLLGLVDRVADDFVWDVSASCCDRRAAGRLPVSTGAPHVRLIDAPVVLTA